MKQSNFFITAVVLIATALLLPAPSTFGQKTVLAADGKNAATVADTVECRLHVVKDGDWVSKLAKAQYGSRLLYGPIVIASGLERPDRIYPGDTLWVPLRPVAKNAVYVFKGRVVSHAPADGITGNNEAQNGKGQMEATHNVSRDGIGTEMVQESKDTVVVIHHHYHHFDSLQVVHTVRETRPSGEAKAEPTTNRGGLKIFAAFGGIDGELAGGGGLSLSLGRGFSLGAVGGVLPVHRLSPGGGSFSAEAIDGGWRYRHTHQVPALFTEPSWLGLGFISKEFGKKEVQK